MGAEGELALQRLARGCRCFAAFREEEVAGYGWLSPGPEWIGEVRLEIRPGPGEAYVWNCVTLPRHRRGGVFRALLCFIVSRARGEGTRRLWIASLEGGAERAVAGAGFSPILSVEVTPMGRLRWVRARGAGGAGPQRVRAGRAALGLGPASLRPRAAGRRH
ncbi:MAG: GNAT family N-acetyltransferase [Candidatus Dormibacterales bacterium]